MKVHLRCLPTSTAKEMMRQEMAAKRLSESKTKEKGRVVPVAGKGI